MASARQIWHELGDGSHSSTEVKLDQTFVTGPASSVTLNLSRQRIYQRYATDVGLSWNLFW